VPVYRWVDHTSELELEIEASSEREVLADGLRALRELLEPPVESRAPERELFEPPVESRPPDRELLEPPGESRAPERELLEPPDESRAPERDAVEPVERRSVLAAASDRPALLAAWLEELLFLAESSGFVPFAIERLRLDAQRLEATVAGQTGRPRPLVKAVTYHRLEFAPTDRGYRARVVFDV
jgi:SHS2 domain-containing protein